MKPNTIYALVLFFFGLLCLYSDFFRPAWFVQVRKGVFKGFWGHLFYILLALFITLGAIYMLLKSIAS